jgi:hypothetical protein
MYQESSYMANPHAEPPFYGVDILRGREQKYIQALLKKYRGRKADEELKKAIYDELQKEKYLGRIKIPFKVVLRQDPSRKYPDVVEVILDTKV